MKYYLFNIQEQNERVLVYANNEYKAREILMDNWGTDFHFNYLGWCTREVADDLGYEVYPKLAPKGLTIKELYAWAQANGCEDMQFVYGDGNGIFWPCTRFPSDYVVSDTKISLFEY